MSTCIASSPDLPRLLSEAATKSLCRPGDLINRCTDVVNAMLVCSVVYLYTCHYVACWLVFRDILSSALLGLTLAASLTWLVINILKVSVGRYECVSYNTICSWMYMIHKVNIAVFFVFVFVCLFVCLCVSMVDVCTEIICRRLVPWIAQVNSTCSKNPSM